MNQAQLLSDGLYYHDSLEGQQWLVYYISRPLIGTYEPIKITPAVLPRIYASVNSSSAKQDNVIPSKSNGSSSPSSNTRKKEIKNFRDLLNDFPIIARQMQHGLEKIFREFNKEANKELPSSKSHSRRTSSASVRSNTSGSIRSKFSNGSLASPSVATTLVYDGEAQLRQILETAVTAAIDLFQLVDKQQLSLLGATTDLTGPMVERLIERYIVEQVHDTALFPKICNGRRLEDLELESHVHQMEHVDVSQVGIKIERGRAGKRELTVRLERGIEKFRKLTTAGSPQEMLETLLATQKAITMAEGFDDTTHENATGNNAMSLSEKDASQSVVNADTLVSLLLVVVIRSQVSHLNARLAYMRNFIFIEDIDTGELGYALSTFEAVIAYLTTDAAGLRHASRKNKRLWQSAKKGDLKVLRSMLEPSLDTSDNDHESIVENYDRNEDDSSLNGISFSSGNGKSLEESLSRANGELSSLPGSSSLAHVFPFQSSLQERKLEARPRPTKRVSMDVQSLSNSEYSFKSRTTMDSRISGIEGDTSIETLSLTQDLSGDSVPMMAIEGGQAKALEYLLSLQDYYTSSFVLEDCNNDETTLLGAAIQSTNANLVDILIDYLFRTFDSQKIEDYIAKQDCRGRTAAHYFFNTPKLIQKFGANMPWRRKDKNGQTPLLAICRSYDHPEYFQMVNEALQFATIEQGDTQTLHMDNHVDSKGNSLLHVVNDPQLALRILQHCDADPNAANDKRFTPLMIASKFGRYDLVRAMFLDRRVDINAKEHRGMTAVELAKDDDVRNRIDDMILVSNPPGVDGRVTAVVRSFFVEDATIRMIIKSAVRNGNGMICVTTCRRSLVDFENLAKWLSVEHPASWLPSIFNFRSPFQIPSKPSRAVLNDIQVRLDKFLKVMLAHSTFSTHELLWEFILVPEIQPEMMAERSRKKAEIRSENIREEFEPMSNLREVESFVEHAREAIRSVNHLTKSTTRRVNGIRNASSGKSTLCQIAFGLIANLLADFFAALELSSKALDTLPFLPVSYLTAFTRYIGCYQVRESEPYKFFHQDLQAISSTILAILSALSRPHALITTLQSTQAAIDRHSSSLRRSDRWPLGLLDDTRKSIHSDAHDKLEKSKEELRTVGCELRYTQQTVAGELAGWQDLHGKMGRRSVRSLVEKMVVREKDRLEGLKRALRCVRESKD